MTQGGRAGFQPAWRQRLGPARRSSFGRVGMHFVPALAGACGRRGICRAHPLVYDVTVQSDRESTEGSEDRIVAALRAGRHIAD